MKAVTSRKIKLENVRLSFPNLFKPEAFQAGQDPKYQATFLFDPSDKKHAAKMKEIKEVAKEILVEAYGAEDKIPKGIKLCLKDNEKEEKAYDGYEGMWFLPSNNTTRPTVVDRDLTPLTEEDGRPYAGSFVNASITLWVQDNQYGKRVNANVRAVQMFRDGERFGGAAPVVAEDEFDVIDGADEPLGDAAGDDDFLG